MKKLVFSFALLCFTLLLFSQKAPMKLGKVPIEDVEMDVYPADSSADAVILCEYGVFNDMTIHFYHQRRIKIITKEGLSQLIFNLPGESKSDVRGFVFNIDENGKLKKERISREHIYIQRSSGQTSVRIAPPNVREGTVLDIEYGYDGYPHLWQFQRTIPVRHSELYIPENENFSFRFQQIGYENVRAIDRQHFIAKEMPAFHAESYVNSINNYLTSILIDLTAIHSIGTNGGSYFKDFCGNWDKVNDHFYKSTSFGQRLNDSYLFLNATAKEIKAKESDLRKRVVLAFKAVHKQINWNEEIDIYPAQNLKEVWDDGSGTMADMNFIFIALLSKLDIEVAPVVISNRYRGTVNPHYPTVNRFNAVVSCAVLGEEHLVIDASDKYSIPGTLPLRALNEGGLMVIKGGGKWLKIEAQKADVQTTSCQLKLDQDGNFIGNFSIRYKDYAANDFRELWDMYSSEDEYLEELESDYENMYIVEYENDVDKRDDGPVVEQMEVELENYASKMGDMLSFNPIVVERQESNPFKLEDRVYPVDFPTPIKEMMIYSFMIPEGYKVEQMPESMAVKTESGSVNFIYNIVYQGSMIQVMLKLDINKAKFLQAEYEELKQMMDIIVKKEKEQVILKKI